MFEFILGAVMTYILLQVLLISSSYVNIKEERRKEILSIVKDKKKVDLFVRDLIDNKIESIKNGEDEDYEYDEEFHQEMVKAEAEKKEKFNSLKNKVSKKISETVETATAKATELKEKAVELKDKKSPKKEKESDIEEKPVKKPKKVKKVSTIVKEKVNSIELKEDKEVEEEVSIDDLIESAESDKEKEFKDRQDKK